MAAWISIPWTFVWHIAFLPIFLVAIFYAGVSDSAWLGYGAVFLVLLGMVLFLTAVNAFAAPIKWRRRGGLLARLVAVWRSFSRSRRTRNTP